MKGKLNISRRKFIGYLLGSLVAVEAVWVLLKSTGRKPESKKAQELFDAGLIDSFHKNQIYPFTSGRFNLVRYNDGAFMAMSTKCTHLGCVVNTNTDKSGFTCPCHSSSFDAYGEVLASPATRPLDTYPIIFKDNHIWVDLSMAQKRQKFESSQLYKV